MMRKYVGLLFMVMGCYQASAQQDPLYSQYLNNPFVINPAYAGITDNLNLSLSYRSQWSGLDGSPKTVNANGHISLYNNRMGAGLMLVSDRIGGSQINEMYGSYSYRIQVTTDKTLAFGMQAGFANYQIDNSKVTPFDKTDPLFQGNFSETKPSIGFGVLLKGDRFFTGLSVPRMLRSTLNTQGRQSTLYTQHVYLMGAYLFYLSDHINLKPTALVKMVSGAPISVDLNAALIFKSNYQVGLMTRNFKTFGLFMQLLVRDTFRLGYVYEIPFSAKSSLNFSTNELTVGIRMNSLKFHNNRSLSYF